MFVLLVSNLNMVNLSVCSIKRFFILQNVLYIDFYQSYINCIELINGNMNGIYVIYK